MRLRAGFATCEQCWQGMQRHRCGNGQRSDDENSLIVLIPVLAAGSEVKARAAPVPQGGRRGPGPIRCLRLIHSRTMKLDCLTMAITTWQSRPRAG